MNRIEEAALQWWSQPENTLLDDDAVKGFITGARWALEQARRVIAREDTVEWARGAHSSHISLSCAIEGLDSLEEDW